MSFPHTFLRRVTCVLSALCLSAVVVGCSGGESPTGTVRGKITLDGKPVSGVSIQFENKAQNAQAACLVDEDGTFTFSAPIKVGSYTVALGPAMSPHQPGASGPPPIPQIDPAIPEKYLNHATSGITIEVAEGENTPNVELRTSE